MSSLEQVPRMAESAEAPPSLEARLDELDHDAGRHDLRAVAEGLAAERTIQESFPPERRLAAATEVRERTKATTDRLRRLKIAATLALTLAALHPEEGKAHEQGPVTAESLIENPERLEELLEGEVLILQRELEKGNASPEVAETHEEVNSVLRRMQDEHARTGKYGALALKIGEIGMRALVSTIGGAGIVACYDAMKEVVKTVRKA